MAEETDKQSYQVDLDTLDSSMVAEEIEINVDANPMEGPPPVDDGVRRYKLIHDASDWEQKETKANKNGEKRTYFATKFSGAAVTDDANNNRRVFERINTLTFDGKSTMGYIILQVLGGAKNPEARAFVESLKNPLDLAKAFTKALAGEPIIKASTKWVAQYNSGTKEAPKYVTALSGQKNFPNVGTKESPRYNHIVSVKGVGEVSAQAKFQDYFPD